MQIGICCHPNTIAELSQVPIDFLEVSVQTVLVPESDDRDFQANLNVTSTAGKPVKAANVFLPAILKCVGPDLDSQRLVTYASKAFSRAEQIGIDTVVFGSGGARSIPEGVSRQQAFDDFCAFACSIAPIAQRHGVTIVIEPLNRDECNFINTLEEGAAVVERCNHPHVRLLADAYHMLKSSEPYSEIVRFGHLIRHVHLAELAGRYFPGKSREDFRPVFQALRQADYDGRISLECKWDNLCVDLPRSIDYLQNQIPA